MSRLRHYAVLGMSLIGLTALVATYPGGVGAAPESASYSTPGTFDWVVPDGVTSVTVDAYGAAGGSVLYPASPVAGGMGGRTLATIDVTPGETLQINVGGQGDSYDDADAALGGINGGGDAGSFGAGAGGGASDVRRGGTALADRVVVAGGGGGAAGDVFCERAVGGAGGGDVPTAGEPSDGAGGGQPGGSGAGGAGGTPGEGGVAGDAGTAGAGGKGASSPGAAGGGGGGGWFGGGGGGGAGDIFQEGAAGGGGSSFVAGDATGVTYENGTRSGDGLVVLSWDAPAPTTTTTTSTSTTTTSTTVPTADPAATFVDGSTSQSVTAGSTIEVNSTGWQADATVTATLYSDPVVLGTVAASTSGDFRSAFTVPPTMPAGQHTLVLSGVGASGGATFVELRLEVTAAGPASPASLSFAC